MDPNANLKEQLEQVQLLLYGKPLLQDDYVEVAGRLAELVEALDGWLSKGGFLPGKWERK
jgi:hypothetical protein